jgi:dTDP-4-dehydrorhamnose 3,5-epimerase
MIFTETKIRGAWLIDLAPLPDERGFFARSFCQDEFAAHGLQVAPKTETKLVRCTRGRIFDVLLDLRPESPTFCRWVGADLGGDEGNRHMLYVPEGCAHGFQTLEDGAEVSYSMFGEYSAAHARGVRWDDPAFGIAWPLPVTTISERDRTFPPFRRA